MNFPLSRWPALVLAAALALPGGCWFGGSDPDEAAFKRAMDMARSKERSDRGTAAKRFGELTQFASKSVPVLIELLKDEDVWVALAAANSLVKLTDQNFGNDQRSYERWRKWWYEEAKEDLPDIGPPDKKAIERERARLANEEGKVALAGGNPVPALDRFNEAIRLDGRKAEYRSNLGLAFLVLKQYDRAERCFEDAKAMDDAYIPAYMNKGAVYAERARDLRAAAAQHELAARAAGAAANPEREAEERRLAEKCMEDAKAKEDRALDEFEHAIKKDKDDQLWNAHAEIGKLFMERRDFERALPPLEQARRIAPREKTVRGLLAKTYYGLDQYYRAWKEIRAVEALGGAMDAGFVAKVREKVIDNGCPEPDKVEPKLDSH